MSIDELQVYQDELTVLIYTPFNPEALKQFATKHRDMISEETYRNLMTPDETFLRKIYDGLRRSAKQARIERGNEDAHIRLCQQYNKGQLF